MDTPESTVKRFQVVSDDHRRTIQEVTGSHYAVTIITMKQGDPPVGKHYHTDKDEHFVVASGGGEYRWYVVSSEGERISEIHSEVIEGGMEIYVPKNVAHIFYLKPGTQLICFSTAPFNQSAMISVDLF